MFVNLLFSVCVRAFVRVCVRVCVCVCVCVINPVTAHHGCINADPVF